MINMSRYFPRGKQIRAPWCEVCARPVPTFGSSVRVSTAEIEVFSVCHGLESTIRLDETAILDRRHRQIIAFRLAPKMLPPIAPPRRRGRALPPEDATRIVVYPLGPM